MSDDAEKVEGLDRLPEDTTLERRMTDGGIVSIGNEVAWDGEAESMGIAPMTELPENRRTRPADDEDIDQDIPED